MYIYIYINTLAYVNIFIYYLQRFKNKMKIFSGDRNFKFVYEKSNQLISLETLQLNLKTVKLLFTFVVRFSIRIIIFHELNIRKISIF